MTTTCTACGTSVAIAEACSACGAPISEVLRQVAGWLETSDEGQAHIADMRARREAMPHG